MRSLGLGRSTLGCETPARRQPRGWSRRAICRSHRSACGRLLLLSGRSGALRRRTPLRTGRAAFTASGSSKPWLVGWREALRSAAGCAAGRPLVHSPTAEAVVSSLSVGWGVIVIVSGWAHLTASARFRGRAPGPVSGRLSTTIDWRGWSGCRGFPSPYLSGAWGVKYRSGCVGLKGGPGGCSGRRVRVGWSGLFARGRPALLRSTALGLAPGPATRCLMG